MPQHLEDFGQTLTFQRGGSIPHCHRFCTTFLIETVPDRWIGSGGPTAWPSRYPDLTPMDFFLWDVLRI
jgi:hypothetical protein